MATAAVTIHDFRTGRFPPLCAKTGGRPDDTVRVVATPSPGWTWILLLFGLFPFLIARAFAKPRIVGVIPMSSYALRRARYVRWASTALFLAALGTLVVAYSRPAVLAWVGLGLAIASILLLAVSLPIVWVSAEVDGDHVRLFHVDEDFAWHAERWNEPDR